MTHTLGVAQTPSTVLFGLGARRSLTLEARRFGPRSFVIVDPSLSDSELFREALNDLTESGIETALWTDVQPELPLDVVVAAITAVDRFAPDVIIAWGGGSTIDLAKLSSLSKRTFKHLADLYGENKVSGPTIPLIALPTTAGTGSEVTSVAVLTDPSRDTKVGISDRSLVPRVAIVDPQLTFGAPPPVTAFAGADALVHAVESFTARTPDFDWGAPRPIFVGRNALSASHALEAVAAISRSLPVAFRDGADVEARIEVAWGSLLSGLAFGSAGTHLSHALQYPIGALTKTPHGLGTGLLLPWVMEALLPGSRSELARVATAMGSSGADEGSLAQEAIDRVRALNREIGIPDRLSAIGVERRDIPRIVRSALEMSRLVNNTNLEVDEALLRSVLVAAL